MEYEPSDKLSFSDICPTINYYFQILKQKESYDADVLIITFTGRYRDGSEGNPDARLMKGVIDTAIDMMPCRSVLLDLTEFEYSWGDSIETIFDQPQSLPLVSVVGPRCRQRLSTLLKDEGSGSDIVDNDTFFDSKEDALSALKRKIF